MLDMMLSALNLGLSSGYRSIAKAFSQYSIDDASPSSADHQLKCVKNVDRFAYCRPCGAVQLAVEVHDVGDDKTRPSSSSTDDDDFPTSIPKFQCSLCGNLDVVTLDQVCTNISSHECATCDSVSTPVVDFGCTDDEGEIDYDPCVMCLPCFIAYAQIQLHERRFRFISTFGYTVACPTPGCNGCIRDAHHMLLLGQEAYDNFKRIAAEACVLSSQGVYCPRPLCGEPFVLDEGTLLPTDHRLICTVCQHTFCRVCRMEGQDCMCEEDRTMGKISTSRLSAATIKSISKECPQCRSPTEKIMGCSHITCTQCHYEWCWMCFKKWSDGCQEDHWFDP